jgi:hypothetical protein
MRSEPRGEARPPCALERARCLRCRGSCCVLGGSYVVSVLQQKEAREGEGNVQGGENVASDAGEEGCNVGSVLLSRG